MLKIRDEWSKSYPVRPYNHLKSHVLINAKNQFKPSYADEQCPATISSLIRGEYARIWLEERDQFVAARLVKPKRFRNDYESWLEKRKPRANESCRPLAVKKVGFFN